MNIENDYENIVDDLDVLRKRLDYFETCGKNNDDLIPIRLRINQLRQIASKNDLEHRILKSFIEKFGRDSEYVDYRTLIIEGGFPPID